MKCWFKNILISLWCHHMGRLYRGYWPLQIVKCCQFWESCLCMVRGNTWCSDEILLIAVLPFKLIFLLSFDYWRKEMENGFSLLACLVPRKVWFMAGFWKAGTSNSNPTWLDQMTLSKSLGSLILYLAQKTKLLEKLELHLNQSLNELFLQFVQCEETV